MTEPVAFTPMTLPTPFACEPIPERDRVRIHVTGEIDIATVGAVRRSVEEVLAAGFRDIALDLRDVTFMDATGLHLMLGLDTEARRDGISFTAIPGPPHVQRVITVAGVQGRLTFRPDRPASTS